MNSWYQQKTDEVLQQLGSDLENGLSEQEAAARLEKYGPNQLTEQSGRSKWEILREQLSGIMVIILVVAAIVSVILGDYADAVVILAIVVLNAALGFQQDYKAEQSMAALKQMAVPVVNT